MDDHMLTDDFQTALERLQEALLRPAADDVYKAGCIQYFEFAFELAWKTLKNVAADEGISDCNSPKAALKFAFRKGWIHEEEAWLDMLASRNRMSHTYSAEDALHVYEKLGGYAQALQALGETLSSALQ